MILKAVLVCLCIYAAAAALLYCSQSRLIYCPRRTLSSTPADAGLAFESVRIAAVDGETISAWYCPCRDARGAVLFCHGNAGNIGDRIDSIAVFVRLRLSVLIFDYRGYGESSGRPGEQGTYRDAQAAWQYLVSSRGIPAGSVIIFGRSLGAAVAAELAAKTSPAGLILESAFTSLPDLAQRLYPWLPVKPFLKYRYATIEKIREVTCPVLIVHSSEDELVPFRHARRLYEKAPAGSRFFEIRGGHNEGFLVSGSAYIRGIGRYVSEVL